MCGSRHWRRESEWGAENIGAGTIKCRLIFYMDSNIMNIKEQMCFQKRAQEIAYYCGRDRVNGNRMIYEYII